MVAAIAAAGMAGGAPVAVAVARWAWCVAAAAVVVRSAGGARFRARFRGDVGLTDPRVRTVEHHVNLVLRVAKPERDCADRSDALGPA